jgi:hypothetical protein
MEASDVRVVEAAALLAAEAEAEAELARSAGCSTEVEIALWLSEGDLPWRDAKKAHPNEEWVAITQNGTTFWHVGEGDALAFQRAWRRAHFLDQDTGVASTVEYAVFGAVRIGVSVSSSREEALSNCERAWVGSAVCGNPNVEGVFLVGPGETLADMLSRIEPGEEN